MNNTRFKLRFTNYDLRMIMSRVFRLTLICVVLSATGICQESSYKAPACISIRFIATDSTFPPRWYNKKINAQAESLARSEIENVNAALRVTMSKYPEQVLCTYLNSIFVLKSMKFYDVPYGGTSSGKTVYITDDEENLTCSYDLLENYFHHEFSSILLHEHSCKFEKRKWKRINPEGFRYGKGGLQAIMTGNAEMSFDPELNERGFLTRYSEASLEEDFNVYCQNIFNGGQSFWKLVDQFPKIKAKTALIIRFYQHIDPVFTESYFRKGIQY
jgi:hypothetical protein